MLNRAADRTGALMRLPSPLRLPGGANDRTRRRGEEHQAVLADLHLVTAGQQCLLDAFAVDVGPCEAVGVADAEATTVEPDELRVPPGDGDVVEEDVAVRMAT